MRLKRLTTNNCVKAVRSINMHRVNSINLFVSSCTKTDDEQLLILIHLLWPGQALYVTENESGQAGGVWDKIMKLFQPSTLSRSWKRDKNKSGIFDQTKT